MATVQLLPAVHRRWAACLGALVLTTAVAPIGVVVATGALAGAAQDRHSDRAVLALAVLGMLFAVIQVGAAARVAVAEALGLELEHHLEQRVMRAAMAPPGIGHLEDRATMDRIASARSVGTSGFRVSEAVPALASRATTRIQGYGSAVLLVGFRWWLAPVVAGAWGWAGREQRRSVLDTTRTLSRSTDVVRRAEYLRDLAVTPPAAKEVRVFGLGPWLIERFRAESRRMLAEVWRQRARSRWQWVAATMAASATSLLALTLLGRAAVDGDIGVGAVGLFAGAVLGTAALVHMGPDNHRVEYGTTAVPAVIEMEAMVASAAAVSAATADPPSGPGTIRFEDVTFRYPGGGADALAHLNLVLEGGRSTAIVGVNGAGKTTIVKLLCRFYEPDVGRITCDGQDVAAFDARRWQRRIAALFQDFVHYPLTAGDNIGFGAAGTGDLLAAARRSGALSVIEGLAHGLDTVLTPVRTGGVDLSGGQWQRLALARALVAVDAGARVLVLDEPAANLDVRAEADLYDRFLDITRGLTTVVVSHRFSTVRRADRIVVLDGGAVAEQGSHQELLDAGGLYAQMFAVQLAALAGDADG